MKYKLSNVSDKQKKILAYLGILISFLLMGNSNNNPQVFADWIFKPLFGVSWYISYSIIIVSILLYYTLHVINKLKENTLYKTPMRRFLMVIILISIFPSLWQYPIKFYKSFSKDLNSIYLNRDSTNVNFNGTKEKLTIEGIINVINCKNELESFNIKIKTPALINENMNEEYITLDKEFIVPPKKKIALQINEEINVNVSKYQWYSVKAYEYILFNNEGEVVFKGTLEDSIFNK